MRGPITLLLLNRALRGWPLRGRSAIVFTPIGRDSCFSKSNTARRSSSPKTSERGTTRWASKINTYSGTGPNWPFHASQTDGGNASVFDGLFDTTNTTYSYLGIEGTSWRGIEIKGLSNGRYWDPSAPEARAFASPFLLLMRVVAIKDGLRSTLSRRPIKAREGIGAV